MKKIVLSFFLVLMATAFLSSSSFAETQKVDVAEGDVVVEQKDPRDVYDEMKVLADALILVNKYYVEEKDYEKLVQGAIDGMLRSLDPHSYYMNVEGYKEMKEHTSGKFSGIGIHIGMRHGILTVIAPIEDTPAFSAGLESGDYIIKIDGEKTQGKTLRDAVKKLRGPKGEPVTITIRRADEDKPLDFEIVRDEIDLPTVKGVRMLDDKIGYIRLTQFAKPTADELQEGLDELNEKGMKALVLDLRDNPGGLLSASVQVSQKFIKRGSLVVTTKGRKGHRDVPRKALGKDHNTEMPMVILINKGSASASEIVSGALQDHKRAILVGERSFGKGSVQSVIPMKSGDGTAIRMTTSKYFTPNDRQIHGKGIDPDIEVDISPREWRDARMRRSHIEHPEHYKEEDISKYADVVDRQLQRSVDLLKGLLVLDKE